MAVSSLVFSVSQCEAKLVQHIRLLLLPLSTDDLPNGLVTRVLQEGLVASLFRFLLWRSVVPRVLRPHHVTCN